MQADAYKSMLYFEVFHTPVHRCAPCEAVVNDGSVCCTACTGRRILVEQRVSGSARKSLIVSLDSVYVPPSLTYTCIDSRNADFTGDS